MKFVLGKLSVMPHHPFSGDVFYSLLGTAVIMLPGLIPRASLELIAANKAARVDDYLFVTALEHLPALQ